MILNVSGRTDIVAFYTKWFMKRYEIGYVDVRNPFFSKEVSRIYFKDVEAIVFCTKNPLPIIEYLEKIKQPIIFQATLTPYRKDIEPYVIDKKKIIEGIKIISNKIGKENVFVRYDPILLNETYTLAYHKKAFEKLCTLLEGYIESIIVSFVDDYKNVRKNKDILKIKDFTEKDYEFIGKNFSKIATEHHITVQTCAEERDLFEYGFIKQDCVSKDLARRITGKTNLKTWTARKNKYCKCVEMVDIGAYNSCKHMCKYCYANYDEKQVQINCQNHQIESSLLIGVLTQEDSIKERKK